MDPKSRKGLPPWFGKSVLLTLFILGVIAFFYFDLGRYLDLNALKENKEALRDYTDRNYLLSISLFILIYCIQTALSLPGATILSLAGGFLFGTLLATLYVNLGATTGATLAFLMARYLFRDAVERKFGGKLTSFQKGFAQNAFNYLLMLRLIPLFPFSLINLGSGLTRIPLITYIVATAIGIIPGSFVYCNAGKQLGMINSVRDIASPGVLGAFTLLGLLALVPVIYQKFKETLRGRSDLT